MSETLYEQCRRLVLEKRKASPLLTYLVEQVLTAAQGGEEDVSINLRLHDTIHEAKELAKSPQFTGMKYWVASGQWVRTRVQISWYTPPTTFFGKLLDRLF